MRVRLSFIKLLGGGIPLALIALFFWRCEEQGNFNPTGPSLRLVFIGNLSANPATLRAGGARSLITGKVVDQEGRPYEGMQVRLEAVRGVVETPVVTRSDGGFSAQYRSGDAPGTDTVLVQAQDAQAYLLLEILPPLADINLRVGRTSLRANGEDTTIVVISLTARQGNIANVPVLVEVDRGQVEQESSVVVRTDQNGVARVVYTSPPFRTDTTAKITAVLIEEGAALTLSPPPPARGKERVPHNRFPDESLEDRGQKPVKRGLRISAGEGSEASMTIALRGIIVSLEASSTLIPGDGVSTSLVRARVREASGAAVVGGEVRFSALKGSIPFSSTTDPSGLAQVVYTSARQDSGSDLITARYGRELSDSLRIHFANPIAFLQLRSSAPSVLGNAHSEVEITARVSGETGKATPGVEVQFSADRGLLNPSSVVTDSQGVAKTKYISYFTDQDESILITARVVPAGRRLPRKGEIPVSTSSSLTPLASTFTAPERVQGGDRPQPYEAPSGKAVLNHLWWGKRAALEQQLTGGGGLSNLGMASSELSDTLRLTVRGVNLAVEVNPSTVVGRAGAFTLVRARAFETRSGQPVPGDTIYFSSTRGYIPFFAITDPQGVAEVRWEFSEVITGTAETAVQYGTLTMRRTLLLLSPLGSIDLSADPPSILAGGLRSSRVIALVKDPLGAALPDVPVHFSIAPPVSDTLTIPTDSAGRATLVVRSFNTETDTIVGIRASVDSLTDSLSLEIRAVRRSLSISPDTLSAGSERPVQVLYTAWERTAQRPVVGDTVRFVASGGVVDEWGILDERGSLRVTFRAGDEVGSAWVVGRLGELPPDTAQVVLVDPLHHFSLRLVRPSLLANGLDTTLIVLRAFNVVDDPAPGVIARFESSLGSIDPPEVITDDNGYATAIYRGIASFRDTVAHILVTGYRVRRVPISPPEEPSQLTLTPPSEKVSLISRAPTSLSSSLYEGFRLSFPSELTSSTTWDRSREAGQSVIAQVIDSLSVPLRGVNFTLRANPREIRADGRSRAGVFVHLREATSGVAIAGARVALGASLGSISAEGVTRADGTFTDSLTAGVESGICRIIAFYGERLTATDSVFLMPDPARVGLSFNVEPDSQVVGENLSFQLRASVQDGEGHPVEGVRVGFVLLTPYFLYLDPQERRETVRWEAAFEVEDLEVIQGMRMNLQLRGVDSPQTRLFINRREVAQIELPRSPLWGEYTLTLPVASLQEGVNRVEILGGGEGQGQDRFSIAGVRIGLLRESLVGEASSDEQGVVLRGWEAPPVAGRVDFKAFLTDQPARSLIRRAKLIPGEPAHILMAPARDTILAIGSGDPIPVNLLVTDRWGNPVRGGYRLRVGASGEARVEPQEVETLIDGSASFSLYPPFAREEGSIILTASWREAESSWELPMLGVRVSLSANRNRVLADGRSTVGIQARLTTSRGSPIPNQLLSFTTSRGSITPQAVTNDQGVANATLVAPDAPDNALVRVSLLGRVLDSLAVSFLPRVGDMEITTQPTSVRGDGTDSSRIVVSVTDGLGDPAPEIRVSLSASAGTLRQRVLITNLEGRASTVLIAPTAGNDGEITVIAELEGGRRDTVRIGVRGVTLSLSVTPDSLPANGVSSARVTAQVREVSSGNPVPGGVVFFSATGGTVTSSARLDSSGLAIATYTAGEVPGRAEIRARIGAGNIGDTAVVILVDPLAALTLTRSPRSILANGIEASTVEVTLTDPWGGGVPNQVVRLEFEGSGRVEPSLGRTDQSGRFIARATAVPSARDGVIRINARTSQGGLSAQTQIEARGITLDLTTSTPIIPGDGRSFANLSINLFETTSGHPIAGDTVRFTTTAGVIQPYAVTDREGLARATLRSSPSPAIARVVAYYGSSEPLSDTLSIAFANRFSYLTLSASPQTLLGDGIDSAQVVVSVRDTLNQPVEGVRVYLSSPRGGSFSVDSITTDASGNASATFYSFATVRDSTITVTARAGALTANASLTIRGVQLTLSADPDTLPANGRSRAIIVAAVSETVSGNPVVGRPVFFSTSAGIITAQATTDTSGRAQAVLRAPERAGEGRVEARFGRTLTATRNLVFTQPVGALSLSASPSAIVADGLDSAIVVAQVTDPQGNPASGVRIFFSAPQGGRLTPSSGVSDEEGMVRAVYRGLILPRDSVITVEAVTGGGAAGATEIILMGVNLRLSARPGELSANGRATSTIVARLFRVSDNVPLVGRTITFSCSDGLITERSTTDTLGQASVTYTAPLQAGEVTIRAQYVEFRDSLTLRALPSQPNEVLFSLEPRLISVAGMGRGETARLTIIVRDQRGEPVPDGTTLFLTEATHLGIRFPQGSDTAQLTTEEGRASITIRSGYQTGVARFKLLWEGRVLAIGGDLIVQAGPPDRVRVHVDLNAPQFLAGGFTALPVSVSVQDTFSNPVADSTRVTFRLTPDTLGQVTASGFTRNGLIITEPAGYPEGIWLTYPNRFAGERVWVVAAAEEASDSTSLVFPGALQGGDPADMELMVDSTSLVADGVATTQVRVNLSDPQGRPARDLTEVRFTARRGRVLSPRWSAGGVVETTYRAGQEAGIDTITASVGELSRSVTLRLRPGPTDQIVLSASRDTLRANGIDQVTITAHLYDRYRNRVEGGRNVEFTTTLGEIISPVQTDTLGRAVTRLTSATQTGIAWVTALNGEVRAQYPVLLVSGPADNIVLVSTDRQGIGVRGSGSPETANLLFEIRDDRGVPVDSLHPAWVRFTLQGPALVVDEEVAGEDSAAFLQPDSALTDAQGRVAVTLRSGYYAGAVQVTAEIRGVGRGRAIALSIFGGPPDADHFTVLPSRCILTGLEGTGPDTANIVVTLGDRFSNPVTPGTIVHFRASGGVIEASATTDSMGRASVQLITTRPAPEGGVDTIYAQTVDWQDRTLTASTTVLVTGRTRIAIDPNDGWSIPFGNYQDFAITVADTHGHSLVAGTSIQVSASGLNPLGEEVDGLILTGDGVDEPVVIGECSPRTTLNVRLFNYVRGLDTTRVVLRVEVTSNNGDEVRTSQGIGLPQILSVVYSRVSVNPAQLLADGSTQATVSIVLLDTLRIPIAGVEPEEVAVSVVGGDVEVSQPQSPSDENGRMTATFVAHSVGEGRVRVVVMGRELAESPQVNFVPGPPASIRVVMGRTRLTVGGDTTRVVVTVFDNFGNFVRDGTEVSFTAPDGSFNPSITATRDGVASSIFSSGTRAGDATLTVTASEGGISIEEEVEGIVFLPGPPAQIAISAESYLVQVASQNTITLSVTDRFGNAVGQGVRVALTLDPEGRGSIVPDTVVTDSIGMAQSTFIAGTVAGQSVRIIATSGEAQGRSAQFTFLPGPPGRVSLTADPLRQVVGESVALVVQVRDVYGNPVSDTTLVTFSADPVRGSFNPRSVRTSGGEARSTLMGVTTAGQVALTATAGEVEGSVVVTFTPDEVAQLTLTATPSDLLIGRTATLTATATDRYDNVVPSATLEFTIIQNPGGCRLLYDRRVTNQQGVATNAFTAGNTAGTAIVAVRYNPDGGEPEAEALVFINVTSP